MTQKPGPKRDDPLRIAALREHGRKQTEAKLFAEAQQLKQQGAKPEDIARCEWAGHRAIVGVVVGECLDGKGWVLQPITGPQVNCLKIYCTRLPSDKASKGIRKVKQEIKHGAVDKTIYGDGDI